MAFAPLVSARIAAAALVAPETPTFDGHGRPGGGARRDGALAVAASMAGVALLAAAGGAMTSPVRGLGDAALLFGAGFAWSAACRVAGRPAPRPTAVSAGALVWLGLLVVVAPLPAWQSAIAPAILAAYAGAAAASVLRHGADGLRRRAGLVLAAHAAFQAIWAALAAAFAAGGAGSSRVWDVGLVIGTMLCLAALGLVPAATRRASAAKIAGPLTPVAALPDPLEDALTGIGTHRALATVGTTMIDAAAAAGRSSALLMMDLDRFAQINRRHGAAAADRLLVAFARLAHDYLPPTSLVCRLGEDLFAAVLPGASSDRARSVADDLRALFAHLAVDAPDGRIAATVSIGIAQAGPGAADMAELLDAAHRCLDAAKRIGRNEAVHELDLAEAARLRRV